MSSLPYDAAVRQVRRSVLSASPIAPMEHVIRCVYPGGVDCEYHSRNTQGCWHAALTISGEMLFQERGGQEMLCSPGTVVSIPSGCEIRWSVRRETTLLQSIGKPFSLEEHGALATLFGPLQERLASVDCGMEAVEAVERRLACAPASCAKDLQVSLACLEFMAFAVEQAQSLSVTEGGKAGHSPLSRCLNYIERNIGREISLKELAGHACLGPSRLSQLFRERLGVSPMRHIAKRKAEIAGRLLSDGGMNVGEVSARLGFNSISYFSRFFKRATGRNPSSIIAR